MASHLTVSQVPARAALGSASLAITALCLWGALCFHSGNSSGFPFGFSEVLSNQATRLTGAPRQNSIGLAQEAIKASPARAINEVILARTIMIADKAINPDAVTHLRASYEKQPLSSDAHELRLALIFQNWSLMPADIRQFAQEEATQYARRHKGRRFLSDLRPKLDNGASFAITIALSRGRIYNDMIKENEAALAD